MEESLKNIKNLLTRDFELAKILGAELLKEMPTNSFLLQLAHTEKQQKDIRRFIHKGDIIARKHYKTEGRKKIEYIDCKRRCVVVRSEPYGDGYLSGNFSGVGSYMESIEFTSLSRYEFDY